MSDPGAETANTLVFDLRLKIENLGKKVVDLQRVNNRKENQIGGLEKTIRNQQIEIDRLKRQIAELQSR